MKPMVESELLKLAQVLKDVLETAEPSDRIEPWYYWAEVRLREIEMLLDDEAIRP